MVHILVMKIYSEHEEKMKELKVPVRKRGGDAVLKEPKP